MHFPCTLYFECVFSTDIWLKQNKTMQRCTIVQSGEQSLLIHNEIYYFLYGIGMLHENYNKSTHAVHLRVYDHLITDEHVHTRMFILL